MDSRTNSLLVQDTASGAQTALVPEGLAAAVTAYPGVIPTWAANGTAFITGAPFDRGTLLTIEGGSNAGG